EEAERFILSEMSPLKIQPANEFHKDFSNSQKCYILSSWQRFCLYLNSKLFIVDSGRATTLIETDDKKDLLLLTDQLSKITNIGKPHNSDNKAQARGSFDRW